MSKSKTYVLVRPTSSSPVLLVSDDDAPLGRLSGCISRWVMECIELGETATFYELGRPVIEINREEEGEQ